MTGVQGVGMVLAEHPGTIGVDLSVQGDGFTEFIGFL